MPDDVRERHPDVEWRAMAGMRDRLIHAYLGVDYDLIWDVVMHKVPDMGRRVAEIVNG